MYRSRCDSDATEPYRCPPATSCDQQRIIDASGSPEFLGSFSAMAQGFSAELHFPPDPGRRDAGAEPQDDEVIEQVCAFTQHAAGAALHGLN
jgi:hypothetical protein